MDTNNTQDQIIITGAVSGKTIKLPPSHEYDPGT